MAGPPIDTIKANERQVGGSHYQKGALEHWDMVALFDLDYFQGNISKYTMRWKEKGGIQDLEKAAHYLEKYIEVEKLRKTGRLTWGLLINAIRSLEKYEEAEQKDHGKSLTASDSYMCPTCMQVGPLHAANCTSQR